MVGGGEADRAVGTMSGGGGAGVAFFRGEKKPFDGFLLQARHRSFSGERLPVKESFSRHIFFSQRRQWLWRQLLHASSNRSMRQDIVEGMSAWMDGNETLSPPIQRRRGADLRRFYEPPILRAH